MQLKLTINKARTNAALEILEEERMYSNSVYVHKIIVDSNIILGNEALRVSFAIEGKEVAKVPIVFSEQLAGSFARYTATIPANLFKGVTADTVISAVVGVYRHTNGVLSSLLTSANYSITIWSNSSDFESEMSDDEREKYNAEIMVLTAQMNIIAKATMSRIHWGVLVFDNGYIADSELSIAAKLGDIYVNKQTYDVYVCVEKHHVITLWDYKFNLKGAIGVQGIQGVQGIRGLQGFTGEIGPKGLTGERGAQGPTGAGVTGPAGPTGVRGSSFVTCSKNLGTNSTSIYVSEINESVIKLWDMLVDNQGNHYALNTYNGTFYSIRFVYSRKGEKGDQGIQGIQGLLGTQGTQGTQGPQGKPFAIAKIYPSISAMNSSYSDSSVSTGSFVLINTGNVSDADNAKLYIKGVSRFDFLTDLSGTTGIQGSQGVQGVQGVRGKQGETGVQGDKGLQGERGAEGVQGERGVQGVQGIQGLQGAFTKQSLAVDVLSWTSDTSYPSFAFRAAVPVAGVSVNNMCDVIFGLNEASSFNFAPTTDTYIGGCYIYAKTKPTTSISIVVVVL